ncbi:hypothetical protein N2152v2_003274 [Parachlorella kessleri]
MPSSGCIAGLAVAVLLAQCAFGHRVTFRRLGQGPPGDHQPWWDALNCTTSPVSLLEEEPTTYATFLDLVAKLNLTDFLSRPTPFEDLRAPTEAFFQAWFAASNATALLEFASYNRSELRHARDAVLGLLLPQDFFNRTFPGGPGQPDDKPPHSDSDMPPHDDGAMPPDSQPNPQDSSRQPGGQPQEGDNQPPQGAPGDAPQDAPQGGDSRGPDGGRHLLSRDNGPGGANPGPGGMGGNRPGHGPFPGAPMNVTECPEVTLTPVDAIVEGSAGCLLEDCLACAGVDGCTCVSCRCQCA